MNIQECHLNLKDEPMNINQLFENNFDCYADTWKDNHDTVPPTKIEGDVVLAMTKEKFVEVVKELFLDENIERWKKSLNLERWKKSLNKIYEPDESNKELIDGAVTMLANQEAYQKKTQLEKNVEYFEASGQPYHKVVNVDEEYDGKYNKDQHADVLCNIRCPICGDSPIDSTKKRGHFINKNGIMSYRCFNTSDPQCPASEPISYRKFMQCVIQKLKLEHDTQIFLIPDEPNEVDIKNLLNLIKRIKS